MNNNNNKLAKRDILTSFILSFLTCGIYVIYWQYTINEAARAVKPTEYNTDFLVVVLLNLLTCGIYQFYWSYKMGKCFVDVASCDNSTLFLVLQLFGLGIINIALMQSDINKYCANQ